MNDIKSIETAVGDNPSDTATRLAWADALDDAGHPLRAAYQRLIAEFHARPPRTPRDNESTTRFMGLADDLGYKELSRFMFQAAAYEALWMGEPEVSVLSKSSSRIPKAARSVHFRLGLEQIWRDAGRYVSQAAATLVHPFVSAKLDRPPMSNSVWQIPIVSHNPFTITTHRGLPFSVSCWWWSWLNHNRDLFTHLPIDAVRFHGRPPVRFASGETRDLGTLYLDLPKAHQKPRGIRFNYSRYRPFGGQDLVPTKYIMKLLRKQWPMVREWYFPRASPQPVEDEE